MIRKNYRIELTEKQEKWFFRHFKHTKNEEIAQRFGISTRTVTRLARKFGLEKSKQFMHKCKIELLKIAARSHRIHGTYPPKGFIVPGSVAHRFKPGVTPLQRLGEKREKMRIKKSQDSLSKTRKKEHARLVFGLPQKTKLRLTRQSPARINTRYYLKKKGYLIDDDKRIAYFDENTKRSERMESGNKWYGFQPANSSAFPNS